MDRKRFNSGSTPPHLCCSRSYSTATPCETVMLGPGIFNFDMSILRNFTLGGSKALQFRLEAFNTFNQPVWQDPNTSVTSAQYGQITSTRKPMRELQLGVKFSF